MKTNYKAIILLLISIVSSGLAQGLTIIAIPWYFTDILHKSSNFSILYGLITFIGLFWGLYSGVIIDNYNRKKILLYINIFGAAIFGLIGSLQALLDSAHPLLMFLGFAICSLYYIIFFPSLYAIIQELTNQKDYIRVNSFVEIFMQTTSIIAAIMCGLLLSGSNIFLNYIDWLDFEFDKWAIKDIFFLNAILYLASFVILLFIKYKPLDTANTACGQVWREIKVGFDFLMTNRKILIYGICSQIIFAFLIVELFTLLPLFVKNYLNETIVVFSFADVTYGFGAIIAGLITIHILKYVGKFNFTIFLIILTGYAVLIMMKFQDLNVFFFTTLIIGVTNASARITRMSYLFERISSNLMGRINTIFNTINTLIRGILIFVFSAPWFSEGTNVLVGYKIGIYVLILFALPLIILKSKKFKF